MRTGVADLPLHNGRAPRWLFARMAKLAGEMVELQALQRLDRFFLPAQAGTQASEWRHSGHRTALWAPATARRDDSALHRHVGESRS